MQLDVKFKVDWPGLQDYLHRVMTTDTQIDIQAKYLILVMVMIYSKPEDIDILLHSANRAPNQADQ